MVPFTRKRQSIVKAVLHNQNMINTRPALLSSISYGTKKRTTKLNVNLAEFEKILYQLQGDEPPEKFATWVKNMNDKVVTSKPDWELIFSSLVDLSNKAVNAVICAALDDFTNLMLKSGNYGPFCNKPTQKKIPKLIPLNNGTPMTEVDGQDVWV